MSPIPNSRLSRLALPALALVLAACAQPTPTSLPPTPMPTAVPLPTPTATMAAAAARTVKPVIQILSPANGAVVALGSTVEVMSISADPDGLDRVDLVANDQVLGSAPADGKTLFTATQAWTPATTGENRVAVVAYDSDRNPSAFDIAVVNVVAVPTGQPAPTAAPTPAGDTDPPSVSITPDPSEAEVGQDVDVFVNAVDAGGIVKLELYVDGEMVDSYDVPDTGSPQQSVFHTFTAHGVEEEGDYEVYVIAYDTAGNAGQSLTEEVEVSAPDGDATATPGG
jgi:hypothetical protein